MTSRARRVRFVGVTVNSGYDYSEVLDGAADGTTLLAHLARAHPHSDTATWSARIADGEVFLDGAAACATTLLRVGQRLTWRKPPWIEPAAPLDVAVLFEDDDLLAVHKPAGLPTLPGSGYLENTLLALVRARAPTASPAHRLGRGTSGLVLFTKSALAARAVQSQWGSVVKVYRALVEGLPAQDELVVDTPIGLVHDPIVGELFAASATGKRARSVCRVLERRPSSTLLDVVIETGRPHQIRIHTAAAGHPLVDDPLYGVGGTRRPGSAARPGDVGYHLHAHTLTLAHRGARLRIEAPPPPTLIGTWAARAERGRPPAVG